MKKKLLAAFLGLLMVCALAPSVFAANVMNVGTVVSPGDVVVDGYGRVLATSQAYPDTCPKCGETALFYVDGNEVKYKCWKCGDSGVVYRAGYSCRCLWDCDCSLHCNNPACGGQVVTCGQPCPICKKIATCPSQCDQCKSPTYPSLPDWWGWGNPGTWGPNYWYDGYYWDGSSWWAYPSGYGYGVYVSSNLNGGSTTVSGGNYGKYGDVKTVTITPSYGYALVDVSVNGVSYGAVSQFNLTMTCNYTVNVTYIKLNLTQQYTVTTTSTGNGTVAVLKNGAKVSPASVKACYTDTLTYQFLPNSKSYTVKDVKVNGKSIGAVSMYTLTSLQANTTIDVTFAWKCPYTDVAANHMTAVEFVTEAGIMSSANTYINTDEFKGTNTVSVRTFVASLAELADTADALDSMTERTNWAIKVGLIGEDEDITEVISVRKACEVMKTYLEVLEKTNSVTFTGIRSTDTAEEVCVALDLVSEAAYEKNAGITRYNVAELCYAISKLPYTEK